MKKVWTVIVVAVAWCVTLSAGFTIDARQCFAVMEWGRPFYSAVQGVIGGLSFTPSNVLLLSVLSSAIGLQVNNHIDDFEDMVRQAVLCGLVVFGVVFFGGSWLDKSKFIYATQEDYFSIASACVGLGVACGFNPRRVKSLAGQAESEVGR